MGREVLPRREFVKKSTGENWLGPIEAQVNSDAAGWEIVSAAASKRISEEGESNGGTRRLVTELDAQGGRRALASFPAVLPARRLILVPSIASASVAVSRYREALGTDEGTFALVCSGLMASADPGVGLHALNLEFIRARTLRRIFAHLFESWPRFERFFWTSGFYFLTFPLIERQLRFAIRSFDPDIVDATRMPGSRILSTRIGRSSRFTIADESGPFVSEPQASMWRRYDPSLLVSIVLPVYNGARYLRESIESCLKQSHSNLELIIVDDGSTDETPRIIEEYAGRDPRVKPVRNPQNLGLPGALNVGFARAGGDLLTWTSCDNYYGSGAIEALVRYLSSWEDTDFVYSASTRVGEGKAIAAKPSYREPPWLLEERNVIGSYFLFRRAVYEKLGNFRTDLQNVEDYEYWVRVYKNFRMMRLHLPLYYYRFHPASMTARMKTLDLGDEMRKGVQANHFSHPLRDWLRSRTRRSSLHR